MKKILAVLLVLVLSLAVVACGSKDSGKSSDDSSKDAGAEKTEGSTTSENGDRTLHLLESENIPSLVTWRATDAVSFRILGNINSGLVNLNPDKEVVPDLAESWEVSDDGLKYTFKLRDANWATVDGEVYGKITADDFIYAWKKLVDPKEASQYSFLIKSASIKNGKEAVELSEKIVNYQDAKNEYEEMKVSDFNDIKAATPEEQLEDQKKVLQEELSKAGTDEEKAAIEKKISELSVDNYEPVAAVSAQEQYDQAKKSAEEALKATEASLVEEYGSVEEANVKVKELIDNLGISAPDENTLVVELSNPVPFFMDLMTFPPLFPANQKFVEEKGDKYGTSVNDFLYSGAFIFKDWRISEKYVLVKNPQYWDAKNVYLDAIDYRVIEGGSNDTAVQMYLDGEVDRTGLAGENVEKYGNRPDTIQEGETTQFYIEVNQGKGPDTANKRLLAIPEARKALNMAFDKKYITDKIYANGSLPVDYFLPKGFVVNSENKDFRAVAEELFKGGDGYNSYNIAEAQKLWEEAKKKAGIQKVDLELLIFEGDAQSKAGAHIKDELEKNLSGLTITINALPFAEKIKRADEGSYELNFAGWGPDYPDAMTFMDLWVTGGGHNSTGYSNAEYDKIIDEAKSGALTAPDKQDERFKELVRAEKILIEDDQVVLPVFQRGRMSLVAPKVKNLVLQTNGPDFILKYVTFEEK